MRKAVIGVVAAVVALGGGPLLAVVEQAPRANAACWWAGNTYCCHAGFRRVCENIARPAQPAKPAQPVKPAQPAKPVQPVKPVQPAPTVPAHVPPPLRPLPPSPPVRIGTPKIVPAAPGAPARPLITTPNGLDAPLKAIDAAKKAPVALIDPANPPAPPKHVNMNQQVQNVVNAHPGKVELVNVGDQVLVRPRHWSYLDYDMYHRPILYNPLSEAMTFHYFYGGAFRDVYVAAGDRAVLNVATAGLYPFTAVGDDYVTAGSFSGGAWIPPDGWSGPPPPDYVAPAPPDVYRNVSADVPAVGQVVQVGQVTVVGHDGSQPAGSQDTFLLDDSTLAWGQVNPPGKNTQITVNKTQSLPGVGPTDNGSVLVKLAAQQQPLKHDWTPWALGGGLILVITAGLGAWLTVRRKRAHTLMDSADAADEATSKMPSAPGVADEATREMPSAPSAD